MKAFNIKEVERINDWIQSLNIEQIANDPYTLHNIALTCATYKSFAAEQMAVAKKEWHDAKVKAYNNFILSNQANASRVEQFGTMVVKDYINSKCGELEANYIFSERVNNVCGEMCDVVRTVISSLKTLMNI